MRPATLLFCALLPALSLAHLHVLHQRQISIGDSGASDTSQATTSSPSASPTTTNGDTTTGNTGGGTTTNNGGGNDGTTTTPDNTSTNGATTTSNQQTQPTTSGGHTTVSSTVIDEGGTNTITKVTTLTDGGNGDSSQGSSSASSSSSSGGGGGLSHGAQLAIIVSCSVVGGGILIAVLGFAISRCLRRRSGKFDDVKWPAPVTTMGAGQGQTAVSAQDDTYGIGDHDAEDEYPHTNDAHYAQAPYDNTQAQYTDYDKQGNYDSYQHQAYGYPDQNDQNYTYGRNY